MIIGIDASRANLERKTGVEYYSYFLIQELKKIIAPPYRVRLYSPEPLRGELGDLPAGWEWRKITTPIRIPFRDKRPFLWTQIGLSLEMLRHPPDRLFVPSHALPIIHPKNSVATIHDLGFLRFPESYHPLARIYHRFVAKFAVRHARAIITISEFTKNELVALCNANVKKITVVPLAYDKSRFHQNLSGEQKEAVFKKYNLRAPYLFYVGRLEKKKNILTLIHAFNTLIEKYTSYIGYLELVLVGSPAHGFSEIQKAIHESSHTHAIRILNYVSSEDLPYLTSGGRVFVSPSIYEGFGLPLLEAMAVGTPTVASDIPPLREVAGDAALFAHPNEPDDFAEKIKQILEHEDLRQSLITRGLQRVQKYSWEETAKKTSKTLTN